jgi:hypothetical protein
MASYFVYRLESIGRISVFKRGVEPLKAPVFTTVSFNTLLLLVVALIALLEPF